MNADSDGMRDRARGALFGVAVGDALGMPTQSLAAELIAASLGHVDRFLAPADDHPVSRGLPAGSVTDDTEQTVLLARQLLRQATHFDHDAWAQALLDWETKTRAAGNHDLLGPSTKKALEALRNGAPLEEVGRTGITNGAAMRATPIGILMPSSPLTELVEMVATVNRVTHNTGLAIAAASAVAAAVSAGIEGRSWREASTLGIEAAKLGVTRGHWAAGADIASKASWAMETVSAMTRSEAVATIQNIVGTSVAAQESVPAAFAVVEVADGDPWQAGIIAANLGGDTDTIGAIAAGMAGAVSGIAAIPPDAIGSLVSVDPRELERLADDLLRMRRKAKPS